MKTNSEVWLRAAEVVDTVDSTKKRGVTTFEITDYSNHINIKFERKKLEDADIHKLEEVLEDQDRWKIYRQKASITLKEGENDE